MMGTFIEQTLQLLVNPPGNLVYHAVLAFSIFGALQAAINHWRSSGFPQGRRMVIGLSLMLLAQLLLFLASGASWQGLLDAHKVLPPLDRGVGLFNLVIIIHLWAFPEPRRLADTATVMLTLLVIALAVFGGLWWQNQDPAIYFTDTTLDIWGSLVYLGLALLGSLILVIRRTNSWGFGLGMLLLLAAGAAAHWLVPITGTDFAGVLRLAEMAAYPLLLALPQRFPLVVDRPQTPPDRSVTARHFASDPKVMQAFLSLATESSPRKFYQEVCRTISQNMLADICLLVLPPDSNGQMIVPVGYNLIQDRALDGFTLDTRQAPVLVDAMRQARSLRLPASSTSVDLQSIARTLDLTRSGYLLSAPICEHGGPLLMGLVLLSPYSNRSFNVEDQQYLLDAGERLALILQRVQQFTRQQAELEDARQSLHQLESETDTIRQEQSSVASRLDEAQNMVEVERQRAENLAAMVANQDPLHEAISRLEARNLELEELVRQNGGSPGQNENLEGELRLALEELAHLRGMLGQADMQLYELNRQVDLQTAAVNPEQREVITSISQELRQPMSSIIGYTDLLLGESVGILGAMQRKFLERVKASTERMGSLVDELIQVSTIDQGKMSLHRVTVDLNQVIDEAVGGMIAQISEKNIALRVDLPEGLPPILADRDAIQQILSNLLQNASSATPSEGEISLFARVEAKENEPSYVLIQVADQGGGIPPEELPRVFSRLYKADNALIPGIGDTGVGLSIVKTLVEAHAGRIWVDSDPGRGATFSVLLPLADEMQEEPDQGGGTG